MTIMETLGSNEACLQALAGFVAKLPILNGHEVMVAIVTHRNNEFDVGTVNTMTKPQQRLMERFIKKKIAMAAK